MPLRTSGEQAGNSAQVEFDLLEVFSVFGRKVNFLVLLGVAVKPLSEKVSVVSLSIECS